MQLCTQAPKTLMMLCFDAVSAGKEMSIESFAKIVGQAVNQASDVALTELPQSAYVRSMQSHTDIISDKKPLLPM